MILGQDLRVGNRVMLTYEGIEGIPFEGGMLEEHIITPNDILLVYTHGLKIFPIPIDTDLLAKRCGMKGSPTGTVQWMEEDTSFMISRAFVPNGGYILQYKGIKLQLTGLHHLQNVVYFLFGEELKIK